MLAMPLVLALCVAPFTHSLAQSSFVDVAASIKVPSVVVGSSERWVAWLDARDGAVRGAIEVEGAVWAVALDPAGTLAAVLLRDGRVVLWPLVEGDERTIVAALAPPEDPADAGGGWRFGAFFEFAPDGERLLIAAASRRIVLLSRGGERVGSKLPCKGSWFGPALAWAPDGARFAYAEEELIHFVDARSGEPAWIPARGVADAPCATIEASTAVRGLDFAPDGARLAAAHDDGRIRVFDLARGKEVARFDHVDPFYGPPLGEGVVDDLEVMPAIFQVSYSPDGSRLAYTSGTGVYLGVFDLASGRRIGFGPYCDGRMGEHAALRWTPDGQRVWYAFVSGVMDVHWMQFGPGQRSGVLGTKGTAPVFGAQGRGFTCLVDARLRALDGATGETLWETTVATLGQQVATLLEKR